MHSNDAQMLVLTVLADGPLHGYAINTAIQELTGSRLGPGSLYGALSRLEARALIRPAGAEADASPRERHRTMEITDAGRDALRAELEQMNRIARAGLRALGINPA
ncbi:PadR family transcriptional regulator [Actinomadura rupiterrae]|uniref:PadR family transcriptional regulator n=1 Tax=Actinomadura rupiterrae TaxID=559627 RepID=UPI0020A4C735|nr:helix-turn-helix transcriptional regulator [Actinomadura rupiterrae]MCP2339327.1 DNA-binding PadR family transcriptional regulator [Actinomadura rupiterrae]